MPSKVPRITGEVAVHAFMKAGFRLDRVRGSHQILKHPERPVRLSVPVHRGRNIGVGLLSALIKNAGLTVEQFIELL